MSNFCALSPLKTKTYRVLKQGMLNPFYFAAYRENSFNLKDKSHCCKAGSISVRFKTSFKLMGGPSSIAKVLRHHETTKAAVHDADADTSKVWVKYVATMTR
jgi:hypothetical protein